MTERNSPELQYIETKWASQMSYAMTVELLKEVLPISACLNAETIRHHFHKVAQQQDEKLSDQPRFVSGVFAGSKPSLFAGTFYYGQALANTWR